jgi:hypothetical protein
VLQVERPTVIEGNIVDNELGTPVGGASIAGEVRSDVIHVNVQADENGRFRVVLPRTLAEGNHTFMFNVSAPGYDNRLVTGTLRRGDTRHVEIRLNYNPFDLALSESAGSLVRGWTPFTVYAGSSGWLFHRWQHIKNLAVGDPRLPTFRVNPNFNLEAITSLVRIREGYWRNTPVYSWGPWAHSNTTTSVVSRDVWNRIQGGTTYHTELRLQERMTTTKWTEPIYTTYFVYNFRAYRRNWPWELWTLYMTGSSRFRTCRGQTFTTSGVFRKREYTFVRRERVQTGTRYMVRTVTHVRHRIRTYTQTWVPPVYERRTTGYSLSGRVERNTRFYRTDFSPLPWDSRHVAMTVTPRNNYAGEVRLRAGKENLIGYDADVYENRVVRHISSEITKYTIVINVYQKRAPITPIRPINPIHPGFPTVTPPQENTWVFLHSFTRTVCAKSRPRYWVGKRWYMFGRRFVVTEILPRRITTTHPVHDWVFVGRRRISVSDFRSPPANTQFRNAVPVHVLIPHPSVDAFIGSSSLMLSSPASTTLTVRPNERANNPFYRIAVRAYDVTGRLVETAGYDLSLFENRGAASFTHITIYRNAWDPVAPLPPPPLPPPPPPQPSANIAAGAHTVGNITVTRRWPAGSLTPFSVIPATFTVNVSGFGGWAHGNTVGNGTVSFSCWCRHRNASCGTLGRNPCTDINRTPSITISNGGSFSTSMLINAAYLPFTQATDQQPGSGFVGVWIYVTLHAPNGANATHTTRFSVFVHDIIH